LSPDVTETEVSVAFGDNTVRQSRKVIFVIACQVTMSCVT